MPATIASVTPIMKEVYEGRIREQLRTETVALKRVLRTSSGVSNETGGKYVTFPIHTRRNQGIGSRFEMEALPTAGQQGYAGARIGLKYAYAALQLTGQAISLTDSNPKAFAKALDDEVTSLKNDVKVDQNRQVYGSGNGAISTTRTVVTAVNVVTVVDGRQFQIGMNVDIITLPSTVAVTNRSITAIDLTFGANTITISGAAVSTTVGQIIVRSGSGVAAAGNREMTGLEAIISNTGILYNVDPTAEPEWTSEMSANGGSLRAVSEGLMTQMVDRIRTRGGKTTLIIQSLGVRRAYANLLSQTKSTVNTVEFKGGFKGLAFVTDGEQGEIPVVSDTDAPLNKQIFLNEDSLTYYRDEEWSWLDRDGSMWKQVTDASGRYDAYLAQLVEYHELGCDRRNTNGQISDLTEA